MSDRYKVGFGKPPRDTRFKKGQSGNPKGRPRGVKNLATDLSEELSEQLRVTENGKPRNVSKQRAMVKSLMAQAVKGDNRAANTVLRLTLQLLSADDESAQDLHLPTDDQKIIDLFIERRTRKG